MADKHLKKTPHDKPGGWWWYEAPRGIEVVAAGAVCVLTWKEIRAALARKDKSK